MTVVILERCGTISALNGLVFASFNFVVMNNDDIDEEIFITQNCSSQESLFPDFGLDILDKILGSELSEAHNQHVCEIEFGGQKESRILMLEGEQTHFTS